MKSSIIEYSWFRRWLASLRVMGARWQVITLPASVIAAMIRSLLRRSMPITRPALGLMARLRAGRPPWDLATESVCTSPKLASCLSRMPAVVWLVPVRVATFWMVVVPLKRIWSTAVAAMRAWRAVREMGQTTGKLALESIALARPG